MIALVRAGGRTADEVSIHFLDFGRAFGDHLGSDHAKHEIAIIMDGPKVAAQGPALHVGDRVALIPLVRG